MVAVDICNCMLIYMICIDVEPEGAWLGGVNQSWWSETGLVG